MARFAPLLAAALIVAAAAPETVDPHSPAMEQAAREALPRARILQLQRRILDIRGLTSATSGRVVALRDIASELRAAGLLVTETAAGLRVVLPENLLFDFDKAVLRPDAADKLAALAAGAAKVPALPMAIEGHTDSKGSAAYNADLSKRRAEAVRAWLEAHGTAAARLTARGYGATRPVAPNAGSGGRDDPVGRQKNRRVEVTIGAA